MPLFEFSEPIMSKRAAENEALADTRSPVPTLKASKYLWFSGSVESLDFLRRGRFSQVITPNMTRPLQFLPFDAVLDHFLDENDPLARGPRSVRDDDGQFVSL
jgi:hypothetical protein